MAAWTRPYQQIPRPLAYARAGLVSLAVMAPLIYVAYRTAGQVSWARLLPLTAIVAVLLVVIWRHLLVGVEVGEAGIRVRGMWQERVVPWSDVHRVLVVEDPAYRNWTLSIATRDGTWVPTPICKRTIRVARPQGPFGCVMLPAAELDALGHALDAMAAAKSGRVGV